MLGSTIIAGPLLLVFAALPCTAAETGTLPIPAPEHRTLDAFGASNPSCTEWTDMCAVCLRANDGTVGCSLPGIACQPSAIICKTPTSDAVPY